MDYSLCTCYSFTVQNSDHNPIKSHPFDPTSCDSEIKILISPASSIVSIKKNEGHTMAEQVQVLVE
jgi:hypothetical protein